MYIAPNTVIKVLSHCPLPLNYQHTINFANEAAQLAYFNTLVKYSFTNQSYQRTSLGVMRVSCKAEDLFDCNYLMFQNTSFGNKWFYAFITDIVYVNNITSEIHYTIDVLQTWAFDYRLEPCFVVREHSVDDSVYGNLVEENLELGEYVYSGLVKCPHFDDWKLALVRTATTIGQTFVGKFINGIFHKADVSVFDADDAGILALHAKLEMQNLFNEEGAIIGIYMFPSDLIGDESNDLADSRSPSHNITFQKEASLGNYTPRNKKLLCYPYNFLSVTNLQGDCRIYRYEFFENTLNCEFNLFGSLFTQSSAMLCPKHYKVGTENPWGDTDVNFNESITITDFPVCTFGTSDFVNKVAQVGINMALGALVATAMPIGAAAGSTAATSRAMTVGSKSARTMANPAYSASANSAYSVAANPGYSGGVNLDYYWQNYQRRMGAANNLNEAWNFMNRNSASYVSSHAGSGPAMMGVDKFGFFFSKTFITEEFAERIDSFFDMFGYATNKVKVPNTNSRPIWNYVKTSGAIVKGTAPAEALNEIAEIFDAGVTFWKNGSQLGNYGLAEQNKA